MKRDAICSDVAGTVSIFSTSEGQGVVTGDDQRTYRFHCTQIVGGARSIATGTAVRFDVIAGHLGKWEATRLQPLDAGSFLCPVCATPIVGRSGTYEICPTCGWEDDPVQSDDSSYVGGANAGSLDDARSAWDRNSAGETA